MNICQERTAGDAQQNATKPENQTTTPLQDLNLSPCQEKWFGKANYLSADGVASLQKIKDYET